MPLSLTWVWAERNTVAELSSTLCRGTWDERGLLPLAGTPELSTKVYIMISDGGYGGAFDGDFASSIFKLPTIGEGLGGLPKRTSKSLIDEGN
jgi:hypothetical protein